jgi:hypothetical protein
MSHSSRRDWPRIREALIAFECAFCEQGLASVSKFLSMRLTVRDLSDQNHL